MEIEQENVIQQDPIQQGGGRFGQFGQFQPRIRQQKPQKPPRQFLDYGRPKIVVRPKDRGGEYDPITAKEFMDTYGGPLQGRNYGTSNPDALTYRKNLASIGGAVAYNDKYYGGQGKVFVGDIDEDGAEDVVIVDPNNRLVAVDGTIMILNYF